MVRSDYLMPARCHVLGRKHCAWLDTAVAGFLPRTIAAMASMLNAIAPTLGDPPSVVAREPAI
ncbi:MAG: hypothetical protein R2867_45945 [Caldilineaceae bacterium]